MVRAETIKCMLWLLAGWLIIVCNLACKPEPVAPPEPTDNNSFATAWNIALPYSADTTVPITDSAEFFHFGIGSTNLFGMVIVINVELVEPSQGSFYLRSELYSEKLTFLTASRDTEFAPSLWVASRPMQNYYLRITPIGNPGGDRYRYHVNITAAAINDAFEPDDDTSDATPLLMGIESSGAYLVDAFSDSLTPMASLPDFYSFELDDTATIYLRVSRLGGDCQPQLRLYRPDGEIFGESEDTLTSFDLTGVGFEQGKWFIEIDDKRGLYPQYGTSEVEFNYLELYTVEVNDHE